MDRSFSQAAQRRLERLANRDPLPSWFQPLSYALLIVFGLYLAYQIALGPHAAPPATTLPPSAVSTLPPATTPSTTPVTTPVGPGGEPTVAVQNTTLSGSLNVPAPAVTLAKRVAVAEVTGRAAGLPVAPGSSRVPGAAVPYAGAAIQSIQVDPSGSTSTNYSFLVTVSTGPSAQTGVYSVDVIYVAGTWRYSSQG